FDAAIEQNSNHWYWYKLRAVTHFHLGHLEDALADIRTAVDKNPADGSNFYWMPPDLVAACPDQSFRDGVLELADATVAEHDSAYVRIGRASLLEAFGEDVLAETDLDKAIELEPENYDWRTWRISFFSERERWSELGTELATVIELKPEQHYRYYQLALVALIEEHESEYQQACLQMLETFEDSDEPMETQFTAWTCALAPNAVDDYAVPLTLAESAVEAEPENQQYLNTLGAIQLRAGQYEEALTTFDQTIAVAGNENTSSAYDYYFRALAEQALDRPDDARLSLVKANELAAEELENEDNPPPWNRKLTLELLRSEAEELIEPADDHEPESPSPPEENND
ncbi:MAG: hypothetical protein AB7V46_14965, partial [Thermomicrobiales bacterium]